MEIWAFPNSIDEVMFWDAVGRLDFTFSGEICHILCTAILQKSSWLCIYEYFPMHWFPNNLYIIMKIVIMEKSKRYLQMSNTLS